ncbi:MAG: class I SAM-dependent methyltransferase [Luminiphilus sp.]
MSQSSVRNIPKLPTLNRVAKPQVARELILRLFRNIRVGTLTLRDGDETFTLGNDQRPEAPHAHITVHNPRAYWRVLTGGSIASGEAYIDGDWSSRDLTEVTRLFSANMETLLAMTDNQSWIMKAALKVAHFGRRNTMLGSKENISAHYDLGNDFFALFLDPTMMYSAAVYPAADSTLDQAAIHKLDLICQSLELSADDELIEIGTGWGGMAIYAAEHYGCRVTTTTISQEQYEHTRAEVAARGLQDRITVLCQDYRKLEGSFDKLVSIEMIEAVGHEFYESYFQCVSRLLKPTGKAVIQAITIPDQRYDFARQSVDYIKRYIFPGGCLPSLGVIADNLARHTDLQMTQLRDITLDYARTLEAWHHSFLAQLDRVREMGFDDRFIRMWRFYLSYCEGGFRERIIGTYQITMAKPGYRPA